MEILQKRLFSILFSQLLLLCITPNFVSGQCTVNAQCGAPTQKLCSSSGYCSFCSNDADCATSMPEYPVCSNFVCVKACTTNSDCPNPYSAKCNNGKCEACAVDSDCATNTNFPAGSKCSSGTCASQCSTTSECVNFFQPRCLNNACDSCYDAADCTKFPKTSFCMPTVGCVECAQDSQCPFPTMTCMNYRCTCSSDSQCTKDVLSKCKDSVCQPCSVDSDCSHITGKNSCSAGTCVAAAAATPPNPAATTETSSVSSGVIIGATIGSVAGVLLIGGIASYLHARRKRLQRVTVTNSAQTKNQAQTELSPLDQKQQA